jgi:hypothetical protein
MHAPLVDLVPPGLWPPQAHLSIDHLYTFLPSQTRTYALVKIMMIDLGTASGSVNKYVAHPSAWY